MTVLTKTLLTLVRSHLMTLVLLSVWHSLICFNWLLSVLLNLCNKALSGLKCGDVVLGDGDGSVL